MSDFREGCNVLYVSGLRRYPIKYFPYSPQPGIVFLSYIHTNVDFDKYDVGYLSENFAFRTWFSPFYFILRLGT